MMAGVEFFSPQCAQSATGFARDRHLLIERCGPRDEVIKVFAPINIDCDLFGEGLRRLALAIEQTSAIAPNKTRSAAA